ncbi:unnamed protein product [Gemmata massiliana]|uniref:Uncharacterized protein n=1 Tax=Gemmata massiliana TaxID=1210884 RepID=A0A6P2D0D6_9BACT|nr:unnamed protein product [Gemmata massiliana]
MPAQNASPDDTLSEQQLVDSARNYARQVTGQGVERITLALTDGTK